MDLILTAALALVLTPALALAFVGLAERRALELPRSLAAVAGSADGLTAAASLLLAAATLALIPWPLHPAGEHPWVGHPVVLWAVIEGAFLVPLLPGLLAPSPLAARAASREAQISVAGRMVVWLAIGVALWGGAGWSPGDLPGRLLALAAGLMALPAAAGIGPFGPERSLSPSGAEEGLDDEAIRLLRFARAARAATLMATLVVASLPPRLGGPLPLPAAAPAALALSLGAYAAAALAIGRATADLPRTTLPGALRWCWARALPLAAAALVYVIAV
ncbi:MAG: hypothetical protein RLZZ387_2480 [Chloroflexota bacterium]